MVTLFLLTSPQSWAGTIQCTLRVLRVTIADWIPREGEDEKAAKVPLCTFTMTDSDIRASLGERTMSFSATVGSVVLDDVSTPHTAYTRVIGPTQGTFTASAQSMGNQPMASVEIVQNPTGR